MLAKISFVLAKMLSAEGGELLKISSALVGSVMYFITQVTNIFSSKNNPTVGANTISKVPAQPSLHLSYLEIIVLVKLLQQKIKSRYHYPLANS